MMGEYVITQKDISGDVMFPDTVAYGGWELDDHFSTGFYSKGAVNIHIDTPRTLSDTVSFLVFKECR